MSSSQLQTLSNNFNSLLLEYQNTYKDYINNIDSKEKSKLYSFKLQKINQQLMDINKELNTTINNSNDSYQQNVELSQEQNKALEQNYAVLTHEKQEIKRMLREHQILNSAKENSNIQVTMNYYNYILLFIIMLLLIFLFIKFSLYDSQVGGKNIRTQTVFKRKNN